MVKFTAIGQGTMGRYSADAQVGKAEITVYDLDKTKTRDSPYAVAMDAQSAVRNADFVLFAVPTEEVSNSMKTILPYCKSGAIISGQTSRKTPEKVAFDRHMMGHPMCGLEMVTIHTMCNPEKVLDPSQEILAIIPNRCSSRAYEKAMGFYKAMSNHIEGFVDVEDHDNVLTNTQVNTSHTNLAVASAFASAGCFPWIDKSYGSGLDAMKFTLAMRIASFPADIYRGIQFDTKHGKSFAAKSSNFATALCSRTIDSKATQLGNWEEYILKARDLIFRDRRKPILDKKIVESFGAGETLPNSHVSDILWVTNQVQRGVNPFADLRGTTPMHTATLCRADYLFTADNGHLLEQAIQATGANNPTLEDDKIFFDEWFIWNNAIKSNDPGIYDMQHQQMIRNLERSSMQDQIEAEVEKSKELVSFCRSSLKDALRRGNLNLDPIKPLDFNLPNSC